MKTRPARTLLELCVAAAIASEGREPTIFEQLRAVPKGTRVCQYVVEWAIALQDGCEPTVRDVAAWWKEAEKTAYRRNRDYRECFPGEANPEQLARQVLTGVRRGQDVRAASLMQLPVPA